MTTGRRLLTGLLMALVSGSVLAAGNGKGVTDTGLGQAAKQELIDAGVTRYVGHFTPFQSVDVGEGWTQHTYNPGMDDGPICIAGTPYSVFTRVQDPEKLLIMLQGGGACWQDFYNCNILAEDQAPPPPPVGIWGPGMMTPDGFAENPLADYSIVYLPYCDGSVFSGDNAAFDPAWQAFLAEETGLPPETFAPVRFHRGLRNVTAGVDLARAMFPGAEHVMVAGSSAGGVGVAAFAPFLARMAFGNNAELRVFNDAGPVAINTLVVDDIMARANDWQFGQFYPASCTDCSDMGQSTPLIKWRLDNDSTIREAFYSTDADFTNRFFVRVPTQSLYRALLLAEHGALNAAHPQRYKSFIVSGDGSHTALQTPRLFLYEIDGVPLYRWLRDFAKPDAWHLRHDPASEVPPPRKQSVWQNLIEEFEPVPVPAS